MENQLQIFSNPKFGTVRTVLIDGVPYFVGKDVTDALGYSNSRDALAKHVDAEDKLESQFATSGQRRTMTVINESGLFSLILSSKLPQAKEFKHWVTSEVLPSIRKYGGYVLDRSKKNLDAYKKIAADPDFLFELAVALKTAHQEQERLATENLALNEKVAELKPKASYCDTVLNSQSLIPITVIAKEFGLSGVKLNKLLAEWGIQFKVGGMWQLTAPYATLGWTQTRTFTYTNSKTDETETSMKTYWTQAGRAALFGILNQHGFFANSQKKTTFF